MTHKNLFGLRNLILGKPRRGDSRLRSPSRTSEARRLRLEPLECRVMLTEFAIVFDGENIHVSAGSGTGGAYIIGDTFTVQWDSTSGGSTGITEVAFSLADSGQTVQATETAGIWTATFEITAGNIAKTGFAVSVAASDGTKVSTGSIVVNAGIDTQAPTVTPSSIAIACSGSSGIQSDGSFVLVAGDTVTVTWDNNADGNTDIGSVAANFTAFGGSTVAATNNGDGTWSASWLVETATTVTAANVSIPVTAVDTAGNSTTAIRTEVPTVSSNHISVTGGSGTDGTFIIGDTVTLVWDSSPTGDNCLYVETVAVDFSGFGGANAVAAHNDGNGIWSATCTIESGSIETTNGMVAVVAGNSFTSSSGAVSNLSVDNACTTTTHFIMGIAPSGTDGSFIIGDTITPSGSTSSTDIGSVRVDLSAFGATDLLTPTINGTNWSLSYTILPGTLDASLASISVIVRDVAGNESTYVADQSDQFSIDNCAPTATTANIAIGADPDADGIYVTGDLVTVAWDNSAATGDNNADISSVTVDFSQFGGGVKTAVYDSNTHRWTAEYTIAEGTTVTPAAAVSLVATDDAGNATTASAVAPSDTSAPAVAVTAPAGHATSGSLAFAVHFSEAVTGFTADDVTVGGNAKGTLVAAVSGSGQDYTVTISGMKAGGTVTVAIAAGVAEDAAENANLASNLATATYGGNTVAMYDPTTATFYLRDSNDGGIADETLDFGPDGNRWVVLTGDWNGDGVDTVGLYDPTTSTFYLRNTNDSGIADMTFVYGAAGAGWTPVAGDWDGDGVDTIGLYDAATGTVFLRDTNTTGYADVTFTYGPAENDLAVIAGDWNSDGVDTVGLYDRAANRVFLRDANTTGYADVEFGYGPAKNDWAAVAGDWDGDGVDTIGLYDSTGASFYLRNSNTTGFADNAFMYGPAGNHWTPIIGSWTAPSSPAAALTAASRITGSPSAPAVAQSDLDSLRSEAVRRWTASGINAATLEKLKAATITVADLSGSNLAVIDHGAICIDSTAAGWGWFVDATPSSDEEYAASGTGVALQANTSSAAVDRIDLLTVLEQELGQVAGLDALIDCVANHAIDASVRSGLLLAG